MHWITLPLLWLMATTPPSQDQTELERLFEETMHFLATGNPLDHGDLIGDRANHLLPQEHPDAYAKRHLDWKRLQKELRNFKKKNISESQKISLELLLHEVNNEVGLFETNGYLVKINADTGFHSMLTFMPSGVPFQNEKDYDKYLQRLSSVAKALADHKVLLNLAISKGYTLPAETLDGYDKGISAHVVKKPENSIFYSPFEKMPESIPLANQNQLIKKGRKIIADSLVPAFADYAAYMRDTYIPNARKTTGATQLPNGNAYYQQRIKYYTTLDLSPDEIHQIGLAEVKRIRSEMEHVIREVAFEGSFDEFLHFLRTDPQFYPKTGEELLHYAAWLCKKMDGKLPQLFKIIPRQPYSIQEVPADIAPKYTAGRYSGSPITSTRPGHYWVNTYNLKSRPLYNMEALTLHEAVPGHHLQNALAQEQDDQPAFRRYIYISAFGEGWALYAERLGLEVGFYQDPYANFGRLTYEMWRACRLVVDTGLHAKGWTRQQAIDYLLKNTALSKHEVTTETDRYISWPAQALSYKLGELKIRELRQLAERKLGSKFDLRDFHHVILRNGSVTLEILEEQVQKYIEATAK